MTNAVHRDPFTNTIGLVPRYMRTRQAAAARGAVEAPAPAPKPVDLAVRYDTVTPELRRRILAAAEGAPRRQLLQERPAPSLLARNSLASLASLISRFATVVPQAVAVRS
jgi:hypothetical protein